MTYKLQVWGFIVGAYVTISEHATKEEVYAARDAEKARRDAEGMYTDIMTFRIEPPKEGKAMNEERAMSADADISLGQSLFTDGFDLAAGDDRTGVFMQIMGRGERRDETKTVIYVTATAGSPPSRKSEMARLIAAEYALHGIKVVTLTHREELVRQDCRAVVVDNGDEVTLSLPDHNGLMFPHQYTLENYSGWSESWFGKGKAHRGEWLDGFDFKKEEGGKNFNAYDREINAKRKLKAAPRGPRKGMR